MQRSRRRQRAERPRRRARPTTPDRIPPLLQLQAAAGNRAVTRTLLTLASVDRSAPTEVQRSLDAAFGAYRDRCSCGEDLGNNCAHYLSEALIQAGYDELDGGEGGRYRRHDGRVVCRHGRPVRARELETWFASRASSTHEGEPTDENTWAVWQGGGGYWGGHVVLHEHHGADGSYDRRGTGDYPRWPTQNHYRW